MTESKMTVQSNSYVAWMGIVEYPGEISRNPLPSDRPYFPATAASPDDHRRIDATSFPRAMVEKIASRRALPVYWIHEKGCPEHGAFYWPESLKEIDYISLVRIEFDQLANLFDNALVKFDLKVCHPAPLWTPPAQLVIAWPISPSSQLTMMAGDDKRPIDFGSVWATTVLACSFRWRTKRYNWVRDQKLDLSVVGSDLDYVTVAVTQQKGSVQVFSYATFQNGPDTLKIPVEEIQSVKVNNEHGTEQAIVVTAQNGTSYAIYGPFSDYPRYLQSLIGNFMLGVWDGLPIDTFAWNADQNAWIRDPLKRDWPIFGRAEHLPNFIMAIQRSLDDKTAGTLFRYDPESGYSVHLREDGSFTIMQCKSMKSLLIDRKFHSWSPQHTTAFIETGEKKSRLLLERCDIDRNTGLQTRKLFDPSELIRCVNHDLDFDRTIADFLCKCCLFNVTQRLRVIPSPSNDRLCFGFPLWTLIWNDLKKFSVINTLSPGNHRDEVSEYYSCDYRPSKDRHPMRVIRRHMQERAKLAKVDQDPDVQLMIQRLSVDETLCWTMWLNDTANLGKVTWCPTSTGLVSAGNGRKLPLTYVQPDRTCPAGILYVLHVHCGSLSWLSVAIPDSVAKPVHERAVEMLATRTKPDQHGYGMWSNVPLKCLRRSEAEHGASDTWVFRTRAGQDHPLIVNH